MQSTPFIIEEHKTEKNKQIHHYYMVGEIGPPTGYIEWVHNIRNAGEEDEIYLHINSEGGDVFTVLQLLRAWRETNATKIVSVEGACNSAGTFFLTLADKWVISDHSTFMFHDYSGIVEGKGGEMYNEMVFHKKWSAKLMRERYAGLLTEEEILDIEKGQDIWMDSEEVIERLMKFHEERMTVMARDGLPPTEPTKSTANKEDQVPDAVPLVPTTPDRPRGTRRQTNI